MFDSLRVRLLAAFGLVLIVALLVVGAAFAVLLQEQERSREWWRLRSLAYPFALQTYAMDRRGLSPEEIVSVLREQAEASNVRVVLADGRRQVIAATHEVDERSATLPPPKGALAGQQVAQYGTLMLDGQEQLFLSLPLPGPRLPAAPHYVMLVVPQTSIGDYWLEILPSMLQAALIALVLSTGLAFLLSNSIARPLARITRASEEMAHGRYDQRIEAHGDDEVGRLAKAFNTMAQQVALSDRTLRDFLANVSHELRTPLTSIQGFSQALIDDTITTPADRVEAGRIINEEATRMARLVEELLLLSKLESGQIALERVPVDVGELARTSVRRAERRAAERQVEIRLIAANPPRALGDGRRLEQVVDNLVTNAVKYTPPGGQVTVRVEPATGLRPRGRGDSEPQVAIAVHNTGSYIPPDELPRIFERFYQVEKSRAGNQDGSGLGLAIAREIVQALGGTITASSNASQGTTFVVTLPAAVAAPTLASVG